MHTQYTWINRIKCPLKYSLELHFSDQSTVFKTSPFSKYNFPKWRWKYRITWSSRSFKLWVTQERLSSAFWTSHLRMSLPLTAVASSACNCSTSSSLEYSFSLNRLVSKVSALSSDLITSYIIKNTNNQHQCENNSPTLDQFK